ncbi:DUF4870 domain-containing protein [Ornithinimicrobium ciconiae]|uniref:DUF4870 domain-containing protein n=1 Tax=Ornithinimicrobium ciconiae TaxID=2594265 RepID=A0A516GC00_9MICO|nr:DUF4870 domain-containing protein [Ornithinimicrobium ciconiae]QDO89051.1 DUF4870 domain-containing protein [Ornithinimicrobium ciconiae]
MTDNPQDWQPGQTPPPPHNPQSPNPQQPGPAGQPQGPGPEGASPQGLPQQGLPQQGLPPHGQSQQGHPQHGQWQSQPQQGGWQGQPMQGGQGPRPAESDERTWMLLAHLSAPIAFIVSFGTLSILGPLLIWFLRKDDSQAVRTAASGAFNFNLTFWILYLLGWVVGILTLTLGFLLVIPFWIVLFLVAAYVHIKGAMRAARGETYIYPFQLKVLN